MKKIFVIGRNMSTEVKNEAIFSVFGALAGFKESFAIVRVRVRHLVALNEQFLLRLVNKVINTNLLRTRRTQTNSIRMGR